MRVLVRDSGEEEEEEGDGGEKEKSRALPLIVSTFSSVCVYCNMEQFEDFVLWKIFYYLYWFMF
jgi:hypothetical protein